MIDNQIRVEHIVLIDDFRSSQIEKRFSGKNIFLEVDFIQIVEPKREHSM
nr:MAG TPA: hypothetical protein [Caudoviricetes sp.]